jgi:hypothetical protein
MKKYIQIALVVSLLLSFSVGYVSAGRFTSDYDQRWDIYVTNCQGETTIYYDCAITNNGQSVVSFIPEAGKISGFQGPEIKIMRNNSCTEVIMIEKQ